VRDSASQLAPATLLALKIRELSLGSSLQIDKSLIAKLLRDPASITELVRRIGLSDAVLKSLDRSTSPFCGLVQQILDPELVHRILPKMQNFGIYETSSDPSTFESSGFVSDTSEFLQVNPDSLAEFPVAQPFHPTADDIDKTIDDLTATLRNAYQGERVVASSRFFASGSSGNDQRNTLSFRALALAAAASALVVSLLWILFR
jgi:hypothetical protein